MLRKTSQAGFTLIEMVFVITIFAIIMGMSSVMLYQGLNTFDVAEGFANDNWQGQLAVQRMSRDIRLVRSPADITTWTAGSFGFTDIYGNTILYSLGGTNLTLTMNGNAEVLASDVSILTFSYWDRNGAGAGAAAATRNVAIYITIGRQNGGTYGITSLICPRNFT